MSEPDSITLVSLHVHITTDVSFLLAFRQITMCSGEPSIEVSLKFFGRFLHMNSWIWALNREVTYLFSCL